MDFARSHVQNRSPMDQLQSSAIAETDAVVRPERGPAVFHYRRAVRFDDVDAAQIVFFARFLDYCHEALEAVLDAVDGGHARLILERRVGFPAIHIEMDFMAPLRYGDVLDIRVTVPRIGATSA